MMKHTLLFLLLASFSLLSFKNGNPAYRIFKEDGKAVKFGKMMDSIQEADIILFGEYHNNPISHWLQLEVTKRLYAQKGKELILAAEMFESDNQVILDEYLTGLISQKRFEAEARLWGNYKTDYKPLVEFAKDSGLHFVASNIPRRYASLVSSKGFEGLTELSEEAKKWLPPLPVAYNPELNCYKNMLNMGGGMQSHVNNNFPKAQAIKDATMAHFILKNWQQGKVALHFNGAYHSDNFESIYWYLKQQNPELKIVTITTVSQEDIKKLEDKNSGKADFIISVVSNMTTTY